MLTFILAMLLQLEHTTSFVVFPADCNANPPMLFGGKTLAEMDRCAAITTRRLLYLSHVKDYVTLGINRVSFISPGKVKDLIFVNGRVTKLGKTSITVELTVMRELPDGMELVAQGEFVFVSYDVTTQKAAPHGLVLPSSYQTVEKGK